MPGLFSTLERYRQGYYHFNGSGLNNAVFCFGSGLDPDYTGTMNNKGSQKESISWAIARQRR